MDDAMFKSIFKKDKNHYLIKILVKELLNIDLISFKEKHPGFIAKGKNKKGEETDYYCEVNGHTITIECNRNYNSALFRRNISHLRRMIVEDGFDIVQINFDGYDIEKKNKSVYRYSLKEDTVDSTLYDHLIKIFHINLLYFAKQGYNDYKKLSLFDRMCMIFLTQDRATLEKIVKGDEGLMDIKKAIEDLNSDSMAWQKYTKAELTMIARAEEMANNMAEEKAKDMAKDMVKDMAKKIVHQEKLKSAKKFLDNGIDINVVADSTGLSIEELQNL